MHLVTEQSTYARLYRGEGISLIVDDSRDVLKHVVLDPFFGTGTVGEVSLAHQRECVGIELNPEYAALALQRLAQVQQRIAL